MGEELNRLTVPRRLARLPAFEDVVLWVAVVITMAGATALLIGIPWLSWRWFGDFGFRHLAACLAVVLIGLCLALLALSIAGALLVLSIAMVKSTVRLIIWLPVIIDGFVTERLDKRQR